MFSFKWHNVWWRRKSIIILLKCLKVTWLLKWVDFFFFFLSCGIRYNMGRLSWKFFYYFLEVNTPFGTSQNGKQDLYLWLNGCLYKLVNTIIFLIIKLVNTMIKSVMRDCSSCTWSIQNASQFSVKFYLLDK